MSAGAGVPEIPSIHRVRVFISYPERNLQSCFKLKKGTGRLLPSSHSIKNFVEKDMYLEAENNKEIPKKGEQTWEFLTN